MKHLSPVEFVDLMDGTLAAGRAAHVDACPECGDQAAAMRSVLQNAGQSPGPEPSPLVLNRVSAGIREALDGVGRPRRWGLSLLWPDAGLRGIVPLGSAAALVLAVLIGVWITRDADTQVSPGIVNSTPPSETARVAAVDDSGVEPATGEVWDVLTAVASDMRIEDATAAGMSVHPAAIDRAVQRLAPDELQELGRLLQSELKRPGD
jgi:hypothetical protein